MTFIVLAGCTSFGSGASPGGDPNPDAAASPIDGGGVRSDASLNEADAGGRRWCQLQPPNPNTVCLDFDDPNESNVAAGWGTVSAEFATIGKTSENVKSAPFSLLVDIAGSSQARAKISRPLTINNSMTLDADVRVEVVGPGNGPVAQILAVDSYPHYLLVYTHEGDSFVQAYDASGPGETERSSLTLPKNQWVHFHLFLKGGKFSVTVDSANAVEISTKVTKGASATVDVGIGNVNSSPAPWRFRYDNILLSTE